MNKKEALELAKRIHGHLSPGLALGIRMAEIAYNYLKTNRRGRGIVGIAETSICLPDALQAYAGTTPGNQNLLVLDYGKLAITVVFFDSKEGYRVMLKENAANISPEVRKFVYRNEFLTREEKEKLVDVFISLDEKYFKVEKVKLRIPVGVPKEVIVSCDRCGELQPVNYTINNNGEVLCKMCADKRYFQVIDVVKN